jgi:hypothetical protein
VQFAWSNVATWQVCARQSCDQVGKSCGQVVPSCAKLPDAGSWEGWAERPLTGARTQFAKLLMVRQPLLMEWSSTKAERGCARERCRSRRSEVGSRGQCNQDRGGDCGSGGEGRWRGGEREISRPLPSRPTKRRHVLVPGCRPHRLAAVHAIGDSCGELPSRTPPLHGHPRRMTASQRALRSSARAGVRRFA